MPDTLTEFINNPSLTLSELNTGVPVITNAAGETAVLKDVRVTNENGHALTLDVDGTVLNNVNGSDSLSGSEIIGGSSTLSLKNKTQVLGLINDILVPTSSTGLREATSPTIFGGTIGSVTGSYVTTTISLPAQPHFYYEKSNGDGYFLQESNNNAPLYKITGGIKSGNTAVNVGTLGNGISVDEDTGILYGFYGNTLRSYDTSTDTASSAITITGDLPSAAHNYVHSAAMDGYVFVHPQYNTSGYVINGATGVSVQAGGTGSGSAQRYGVGMAKRSNGDYVMLQLNYTEPFLYYWVVGPDLSSPVVKASGSLDLPSTPLYSGDANHVHTHPTLKNMVMMFGTSHIYVMDVDDLSYNLIQYGSTAFSNSYFEFLKTDVTKASTDFGTVGIRATGIKNTAV